MHVDTDIFPRLWRAIQATRQGQCYLLLGIGTSVGLAGAFESNGFPLRLRLIYGVSIGITLGVLLILTMVIPAIYLSFIRKRRGEGVNVIWHRILLVLYFFPFLTYAIIGSASFVFNYFKL